MSPQDVDTETAPSAARLTPVLSRLRRAVNRSVRLGIAGPTLPEAQVDVLRVVAAQPRARVQDVASQLHLAPNTVSTLVGALVRRGLLRREVDAADGRAVRLSITPQAHRRIAAWRARRAEVVEEHMSRLHAADRRALARALPALERLTASLESAHE